MENTLNSRQMEQIISSIYDAVIIINHSGIIKNFFISNNNNLFSTSSELINVNISEFLPKTITDSLLQFINLDSPKKTEVHILETISQSTESYNISFSKDPEGIVIKFSKFIPKKGLKNPFSKNDIITKTLDNIPVSIFIKDCGNEYRYLYRNILFSEVINQNIKESTGLTDFELLPIDVAQKFREEDDFLLKNGGSIKFITHERDQNGDLSIKETLKSLITFPDRAPLIVGIVWDITETTKLNNELKLAKELAEKAFEIKSAMLANISHEIRTPLNSIIGFSEILSKSDDQEERNEYYKIVESSNIRLLKLIDDILDISKIDSGMIELKNERIDIFSFLSEISKTMSVNIKQGIDLKICPDQLRFSIYSDQKRLYQVMGNLISNAIKYTNEGYIEIGAKELENNRVEFFVKDTGIGIDINDKNLIFERFRQLDDFNPGAGLGLAICKSIIEKMGGEITYDSQKNIGTTFKFTIPAHG